MRRHTTEDDGVVVVLSSHMFVGLPLSRPCPLALVGLLNPARRRRDALGSRRSQDGNRVTRQSSTSLVLGGLPIAGRENVMFSSLLCSVSFRRLAQQHSPILQQVEGRTPR